MKCIASAAVLFAVVLGTSTAADEPLGELAGNWKAASLSRDGQEEPDEVVQTVSLKVAKDEITISAKGKQFPAKIKVDAKAKPAAIDISPSAGSENGRTFPGIYKVENGELVLAFVERGERPLDFKSAAGVLLVRFKKDEKK